MRKNEERIDDLLDAIGGLIISKYQKGQTVFTRQITMTGDLDVDQRARLVEIANKCPVHKMLAHSALVETVEVT